VIRPSPPADIASATQAIARHPAKHITDEEIQAEYERLRDWSARAEPGPGRTTTLGWDLEYPSPDVLVAFLDQVLFRRVNDFLADRERPVILDCGANIGYTVLNYKRQFPQAEIIAFEPDPQFAPLLRRNLERNGARDVQVVETAVWTADGRAPWALEAKDGSRLISAGATDAPTAEVATVDLSRYLDREIDLLKLDIEGAEFQVVPYLGSRLRHVKNILVECHVTRQTDYQALSDVMRTLIDSGFTISLNSSGPWRDLIRRHNPDPLHATQYFSVFGWRSEDTALVREPAYEPYVGISVYGDRAQVLAQLDRLKAAETDNRRWGQWLADVTAGSGPVETLRLDGPFQPAKGFCWIAKLPGSVPRGDESGSLRSAVVLVEDGRALGPATSCTRISANTDRDVTRTGSVVCTSRHRTTAIRMPTAASTRSCTCAKAREKPS
jgi:FkbM family methyltransferase